MLLSPLFRNQIKLLIARPTTLARSLHKDPHRNPSSVTGSYLVETCHLSPQSPLSIAQKINIKTTQNADFVLNFLESHGFTNAQIANLITRCPRLVSSSTVKPKLEFLQGVGFSSAQLTRFISLYPALLNSSLEKLKHNFHLLSSIIGNDKLTTAIRRNPRLLMSNLDTNFLPNVRTLQSYGIPSLRIAHFAATYPRVVLQVTSKQLEAIAESVRKMGFNPCSSMFLRGIGSMSGMSRSVWERKVGVYKSVGWTEGEVMSAFVRFPGCMRLSDENIKRMTGFFVKKMHWGPSILAVRPVVLGLSLEKRVIPRCLVLSVLVSKGLLTRNSSAQFLILSEDDFLNKYVIKYQDQVPEVLQAYNGIVEIVGPEGESKTTQRS